MLYRTSIGALFLGTLFMASGVASADVRVSNSGTVINSTSASASSGGQKTSEGERSTSGKSSASVHSKIISDNGGSSVEITKTVDGKTEKESYSVPAGLPISVVATSSSESKSTDSESSISTDIRALAEEAGRASSSEEVSEEISVAASSSQKEGIFGQVSSLLHRIFSAWWR